MDVCCIWDSIEELGSPIDDGMWWLLILLLVSTRSLDNKCWSSITLVPAEDGIDWGIGKVVPREVLVICGLIITGIKSSDLASFLRRGFFTGSEPFELGSSENIWGWYWSTVCTATAARVGNIFNSVVTTKKVQMNSIKESYLKEKWTFQTTRMTSYIAEITLNKKYTKLSYQNKAKRRRNCNSIFYLNMIKREREKKDDNFPLFYQLNTGN